MKLTLTLDEIKNHYREMFNLDKSDEIEIESDINLMSKLNTKIHDLASNGQKLPAIRLVRLFSNCDLKDAKDFVEQGRKLSPKDIRITIEDAYKLLN